MQFEEVQPVLREHPAIPLVVGAIAVIAWAVFLAQVVSGIPVGNHPAPDAAVWVIWTAFGIAVPALFAVMRLETKVQDDQLGYRFFPIHLSWRMIPRDDIVRAVPATYRPLREFGGWGIRFGRRGRAYTVSGTGGVWITLRDGREFLLGSRRPGELADALTRG